MNAIHNWITEYSSWESRPEISVKCTEDTQFVHMKSCNEALPKDIIQNISLQLVFRNVKTFPPSNFIQMKEGSSVGFYYYVEDKFVKCTFIVFISCLHKPKDTLL